jgi:hypothetical protein
MESRANLGSIGMASRRHGRPSWIGNGLMAALVLAFGLLAATATRAADADPIGHVRDVRGTVTVSRGSASVPAATGEPVFLNDILMVADNGSVGVTFLDESRISLGPGSQLTLKQYDYDPATKKLGFVARLVRGTLLYISGIIAKLSPESVAVETPVATIAVRGTKFLARVEE